MIRAVSIACVCAGLVACNSSTQQEHDAVLSDDPVAHDSLHTSIVPESRRGLTVAGAMETRDAASRDNSVSSILSRMNGACQASGANLPQAMNNYAQQCQLPRVDCDPIGGQWICSSQTLNGASSAGPVAVFNPGPYESPSYSSEPIDPESWHIDEVYQKENYELVFSDEFNGSSINPNRWNTNLRWDGEFNGERYEYRIINDEAQLYVSTQSPDAEHIQKVASMHNPFEFDGTRLAIRARTNPQYRGVSGRRYGQLDNILTRQPFLSGAIASHGKFSQKYGYFEARIKLPSHIGTFPAFWLFHQRELADRTHRSEIDIMENLGHAPWYVYNSYHYHNNVTPHYPGDANFLKPDPDGQIYNGSDFSDGYHVYAVEWSPNRIEWFVDGESVSSLESEHVNYEEMYIILNLAIGGNWANYPSNAGGLGRSENDRYPTASETQPENFGNPALEIDYVRAYRRR